MKVLLVGGGGREHALAEAIARTEGTEIIAVPGNPGIASIAGTRCEAPPDDSPSTLAQLAEAAGIDLAIVGPEAPLVSGLADVLRSRGMRVVGPGAAPARLEASKWYAKELMQSRGVPTANAKRFAGAAEAPAALEALRRAKPPWVVKADGLAAGKGVLVTDSLEEAQQWVEKCLLEREFGRAGSIVVIEEFLKGPELSLLVLSDGKSLLPLVPARDHKRLLDGDQGPNTGGMGAYSPVPGVDDRMIDTVLEKIVEPVVDGVASEGEPFTGILYAGLILTESGPKVLEFNVRFGDPEAQAVLPRLESELLDLLDATASGRLGQVRPSWREEACVSVVAATAGYPESPKTGDPIDGVESAAALDDVSVFQAGTAIDESGSLITAGGRVLAVSALGANLQEAASTAYEAMGRIRFDGMQYRTDIAAREVSA